MYKTVKLGKCYWENVRNLAASRERLIGRLMRCTDLGAGEVTRNLFARTQKLDEHYPIKTPRQTNWLALQASTQGTWD